MWRFIGTIIAAETCILCTYILFFFYFSRLARETLETMAFIEERFSFQGRSIDRRHVEIKTDRVRS